MTEKAAGDGKAGCSPQGNDSNDKVKGNIDMQQPPTGTRRTPLDADRVFLRNEQIPHPGDLFFFRRQPIKDIFTSAIIVLDANVLLLPYKTDSSKIPDINAAYNQLINTNRLRLPAQAVREYLIHQADHIGEPIAYVERLTSLTIKPPSIAGFALMEQLDEYSELKEAVKGIATALEIFSSSLQKLRDKVLAWVEGDPISDMYAGFPRDVIVEPTVDNDQLLSELERRNRYNIPPGYKDKAKEDGGVGDLLIWKTILQIGASEQKPLIFVSMDKKSDWSVTKSNASISPRIELVEEYRRGSNGQPFYLITLSELVGLSGAAPEVVTELRRAEESQWQQTAEPEVDDSTVGEQLIMELNMEMGPGRESQVQPPLDVWRLYFGLDPNAHANVRQTILLRCRQTDDASYEARPIVKHHHTYSIEISGAKQPRPAILRLKRTSYHTYDYWVYVESSHQEYGSWFRWLEAHPNSDRVRGRMWAII